MSWFKKREQTEATCASMLASQSGSNPLHANLNRERFPWQLTRSALAAKFGIRKHVAYDWDVIEIASDRPLVDNLLWPLSAQAFPLFSPNVPAAQFSGVSYVSDDARENLRAVVSQLQPILGRGKATSVSNCIGHRWSFDAGSVELHAWPPELQRGPGNNPAHEREPRLKTGCHVQIDTGFRQPVSIQERAWVESFVPIARLSERSMSSEYAHFAGTPQHELEFIWRGAEFREYAWGHRMLCGPFGPDLSYGRTVHRADRRYQAIPVGSCIAGERRRRVVVAGGLQL